MMMARRLDAPVRAILGPTNTGKTHLAIERMCGHSSGVIGFPLRLLAREVYDRVVAMKGEKQVALLTGEERIVPPNARYFLSTAESMPVPGGDSHHDGDMHRDFAFAAIDEDHARRAGTERIPLALRSSLAGSRRALWSLIGSRRSDGRGLGRPRSRYWTTSKATTTRTFLHRAECMSPRARG